jgi:two-component system, OmpR family, copper resistance phosphate regulon response regulator CusR
MASRHISEIQYTYKDGTEPVRVLVIEDEQKLAAALREGLEAEQYSVFVTATGEEGFYQVYAQPFDLVILDVMLPGRSGLEILKTMRDGGIHTPVLMLTALDTTEDRVRGLDTGADDYLVKPFAFSELLARMRALLRRGAPDATTKLTACDLELDVVRHAVTRSGQVLDLTVREFEILKYLLQYQGNVVSREMLSRDVWKETARHTPLDNVIDVHIARLRRKVDHQFEKKLLQTVRGVGFTIRTEPE